MVVEPAGDLCWRQRARRRRGELDREGDPVQTLADLTNEAVVIDGVAGDDRVGAGEEQLDRLRLDVE